MKKLAEQCYKRAVQPARWLSDRHSTLLYCVPGGDKLLLELCWKAMR
jgi:hypothetical protein